MKAAGVILLLHIYLLVCIYPFLIRPGYAETTKVKYGFLIAVSYGMKAGPIWIPAFIPLSLVSILAGTAIYIKKSGKGIKDFIRSLRFSATDIMIALYALFVILSAVVSPYRENLLWGLNQSSMGLAAQFMFISIYFITSRIFDLDKLKVLVYASLAASAAVSAIGILQRFGFDIFDLYHGLGSRLYLSTIGHYTCFSSYLILFYMLGVYAMWNSGQGSAMYNTAAVWLVIVSVMPCILNADMFFSGLFFALSFLFILSFESLKRLKAFFEIALIYCSPGALPGSSGCLQSLNFNWSRCQSSSCSRRTCGSPCCAWRLYIASYAKRQERAPVLICAKPGGSELSMRGSWDLPCLPRWFTSS